MTKHPEPVMVPRGAWADAEYRIETLERRWREGKVRIVIIHPDGRVAIR